MNKKPFIFFANIFIVLFSLLVILSLAEMLLRYNEKILSDRDIQCLKDSNVNDLVSRAPEDIVKLRFFNGCFMDNGIIDKDPILGYTNLPNVEGYSIRVYGRSNLVVKKSFDFSIFAKESLRTETASFRINNLGNRGHDMTMDPLPNTIRIVFLGDSITFGYYVEEGDTFVERVGMMISELLPPEYSVEVLNAGVSSLNAQNIFAHLKERALSWSPNLVIWSFYLNDIVDTPSGEADMLFPIRKRGCLNSLHGLAIGRLIESFIFSTSIGANMSIDSDNEINRSVESAWKDVEENIVRAQEILQERNIPLIVTIFPSALQFSWPWTTQQYQEKLKRICAKHNVLCIDLLKSLKKVGLVEEIYYKGDLIHPNGRGHAAVASTIVSFIGQHPYLLKQLVEK